MKYFFAFILGLTLILTAGPGVSGDANFTWIKPDPAFDAVVPAGTIIDEYRIYCTVGSNDFVIVVPGYDTEQYNATGLTPGSYTCFLRSYSDAQGLESIDSNSVTKVIYDPSSPNPPASFVFVPAIQ